MTETLCHIKKKKEEFVETNLWNCNRLQELLRIPEEATLIIWECDHVEKYFLIKWEWETKNEVRWWRPRWPAVSQQSFPLLLSDRPPTPSLRGNTAAQLRDASAGGVAMWPGSGKGDVEDTSQKTRRRGEGEPPSYSPPLAGLPICTQDQARPLGPWVGAALSLRAPSCQSCRSIWARCPHKCITVTRASWTDVSGHYSFLCNAWIHLWVCG